MSMCILTRTSDGLRIDEAPPRARIANEILWEAFWDNDDPYISVCRPSEGHGSIGHSAGEDGCQARPGGVCFRNAIVTITGINRTAIYRIGDYDWQGNTWEAAWPD